jgi:hypothetical protein
MTDILSGESLRGRRVTVCPPADSRQYVGAPISALRRLIGKLLRAVEAGDAAFEDLGVHFGGDGVVEIDVEVFLIELDGVEFVHVAIESFDEAFHVLDGFAIDLVDDQIAEALVADGGGGGNHAAEENHAIDRVLILVRVFIDIEEIERSERAPVLTEAFEDGE